VRRLLRWTAALAVLATFTWVAAVLAVFLYGLREEARPADAIVVLGAAQYDGRPSPVLKARLDHAIRLYRNGIAPNLIFTGGVGVGDTVSEAEVGSRYARKAGIPAESILIEPAGRSTEQSLTTVKLMMERAGLHTAVLVSDPFHMLRLRLLASEMGIRAYSSPTRSSPIVADSPEEWRHVLRESLILPFALLGYR
jgi:uncharacterized SAM-binding protein YcdF (DUF218 family)